MERGIIFQLHEGEEILAAIRRHWLAFIMPIASVFFMLLVFIIGMFFLVNLTNGGSVNISENIGRGLLIIISSMYLLSLVGYFYISWLDYYLDIFIITNERIIRLEQIVLFGRRVSEASFHHVQDASSRVKGVISSILNVGTVFVETAGERENFSFRYIKNPNSVSSKILELQRNIWEKEGIKDQLIEAKKTPVRSEIKALKNQEELAQEKKEVSINKDKSGQKIEKESLNTIVRDVASISQNKKENKSRSLDDKTYKDGRIIIEEGVIWQADQESTPEIIQLLNKMDEENIDLFSSNN